MKIDPNWLATTWSMIGWLSLAFCIVGVYLLITTYIGGSND